MEFPQYHGCRHQHPRRLHDQISQPAVARLTIEAANVEVKDNAGLDLAGALNLSSGTFTPNNGSLQATSILIGLAAIFLVEHGTHVLSMPIENDGQLVVGNNSTVVDITGELAGTGSISVISGATLQFSSGTHTISGAATNNGSIEVTDGTLVIAGALSGTGCCRSTREPRCNSTAQIL